MERDPGSRRTGSWVLLLPFRIGASSPDYEGQMQVESDPADGSYL